MKYKLMIVDDNISNLIMAQKALEDDYEVLPVSSGLSALECLGDMPDLPDLVVLDIDMPNVNGFHVISEMKNIKKLKNIPAIFLTAQDDSTTELEGYNLGAVDYIRKPYTASLLKKRINVQIQLLEQKRRLEEINTALADVIQKQRKKDMEQQFALVDMLLSMLGKRSNEIYGHTKRVMRYMDLFVPVLASTGRYDLEGDRVKMICMASGMHDIGKLCLNDLYLNPSPNANKAYDKETEKMHTIIGSDAVKHLISDGEGSNDFAGYACHMCRSHHEKFDGTGYPDMLSGKKIPLEARILSVINTYDNLRSQKKAGKVLSHSEACGRIRAMKNTALDAELVSVFLELENEIAQITQ